MKNKFQLILLMSFCRLFHNCSVALTPKATVKIPPKSEIEVFRFNVFHGEVKNLYGTYFTAGVYNYGGVKIGLFNSSPRGIGLSVGVINTGKDGNFF